MSHWGPRSRGVEVEGDKGWYFTGRSRALREVVRWLRGEEDDRIHVVTGSPGSGKSALLARLVTLSDPVYRHRFPKDQLLDPDSTPPVDAIHFALVARDKTVTQVVESLAVAFGVQPAEPATFVASVQGAVSEPRSIVIDSLDEARNAKEIARLLLAPLSRARIPGLRLLVGSRREAIPALGSRTRVIDLDDPQYLSSSDISDYIVKILTGEVGSPRPSPYRDRPRLARQVADAVAARAYPTFLVARIVGRSLVDADEAVDIARRDWRQGFPDTVGDAFEEYLERFGAEQQRVRDLMQPLAYAAGAGLPWENIWAPIASRLAGRAYSDSDIRWLLQHAGAYIVESTEAGRSVYRLYHQALAEHLEKATLGIDAHQRIADALVDLVEASSPSGHPEWARAHPYIRAYLAGHAVLTPLLNDLLEDPSYLVAASPGHLVEALARADVIESKPAEIYLQAAHHLVTDAYADNASYLEMTARFSGADSLADSFRKLPLRRSWRVPWAHWQLGTTYRLVGRHTAAVTAVAVAELAGKTILVAGGEDGTIQSWDVLDGVPLLEPIAAHSDRIGALAIGTVEGQAVVVSGGEDGTIRRWDLAEGFSVGKAEKGHQGRVEALAIMNLSGQSQIASAGADDMILRWDLATGEAIGAPIVAGQGRVHALTIVESDDGPLIMSAGSDGSIRRWDSVRGTSVGLALNAHEGGVLALATGVVDGRQVLVSGGADWTWRLWDARRAEPMGPARTCHDAAVTSVALGLIDSRPVVVSGSGDTFVRCWDLHGDRGLGGVLMSHDGAVSGVALTAQNGEPLVLSAGADSTLRRWSLTSDALAPERPIPHDGGVSAVAAGDTNGRALIITAGRDRTIRRWDAVSGAPHGTAHAGHDDWVNDLSAGTIGADRMVASVGGDGTMRVWDLLSGRQLRQSVDLEGWVNCVDVSTTRAGTVVAAAGNDGKIWRWNLPSGDQIGEPIITGQSSITSLAIVGGEGPFDLVSASADGAVQQWRLKDGRQVGPTLSASSATLWCMAVGRLGGVLSAVTGDGNGRLCWWDLSLGRLLAGPLSGHESAVHGVTLGRVADRELVFTVGNDGRLRGWKSPGQLAIDVSTGGGLLDLVFVPPNQVVVVGWRGMLSALMTNAID